MSAEGSVSFADDIKPLFREKDRKAMRRWFDLWSLEDVRANADDIVERLQGGDMPCDSPWPDAQVALFERWIAAGKPE